VGRHGSVRTVLLGHYIRDVSARNLQLWVRLFLIEIQDHQARTLAPRCVDALAAPHHHPYRRVLAWRRARAGVERARRDRRAHNARDYSMYFIGRTRACVRDSGGVPVPTDIVRVPGGQRGCVGGMRPAGANGPVGRRGAISRGRRTRADTRRGEPVAVPRQRTCG
jgi:hypothetical protein